MLRQLLAASSLALLLTACAPTPTDTSMSGSDHSTHTETGEGLSVGRLANSPRHQEWVEVKNGDKTIYTWVVYPQVSGPAPVVLLIHENRGLSDWARGMADQIAEAGYIAVAPDLLSSYSATKKRTSDFTSEDDAIAAIGTLQQEKVTSDLQAVVDWAKTIPSSNGKVVSAGFCWGGSQSFQLATKSKDLAMTMVFYGTGPTETGAYTSITSPVLGFYGGADNRVDATIDATAKAMKEAGKSFDYRIYQDAGHAFMRLGEDPAGEAPNVAARTAAWQRMMDSLKTL